MSKSNRNRDRRPDAPATPPRPITYATPPGPITYTTKLKPRPKLLLIVSILFALWVILLLIMYFATIYSHRHGSSLPAP